MNHPQKTRSLLRRQDGQSIVEFALVLPLVALLLFGIVQFGVVFNNYIDLTDAVRAGARKGSVSRSVPDPTGTTRQAVIDAANITLTPAEVAVTSTWAPGGDLTVTASYPYSIDLFGIVFASGDLHSQTTERVE
jgi:Flp pilus assembly protein TadG